MTESDSKRDGVPRQRLWQPIPLGREGDEFDGSILLPRDPVEDRRHQAATVKRMSLGDRISAGEAPRKKPIHRLVIYAATLLLMGTTSVGPAEWLQPIWIAGSIVVAILAIRGLRNRYLEHRGILIAGAIILLALMMLGVWAMRTLNPSDKDSLSGLIEPVERQEWNQQRSGDDE